MAATATVNTQDLVGQIIGNDRYDLRELLGGGSMGYVYRAFDRRLETDVVVKIPRKHKLENPDALRRFKQESKFLVKLHHPHLVSILDVGEDDGVPFFVMPFVSGVASANLSGEFDLILGQEVFGWKLSRQWALGLAAVLVIVLMLMTMYFTNRASHAEQDRIREQVRPRSIEGQSPNIVPMLV